MMKTIMKIMIDNFFAKIKNLFTKIRNFFIWGYYGFNNYDYDYIFLIKLINKKLERMQKIIKDKNLGKTIILGNAILNDYYFQLFRNNFSYNYAISEKSLDGTFYLKEKYIVYDNFNKIIELYRREYENICKELYKKDFLKNDKFDWDKFDINEKVMVFSNLLSRMNKKLENLYFELIKNNFNYWWD